jgi:hypothetical protein
MFVHAQMLKRSFLSIADYSSPRFSNDFETDNMSDQCIKLARQWSRKTDLEKNSTSQNVFSLQGLSYYITTILNGDEPYILVGVSLKNQQKAKAKFFEWSETIEGALKKKTIDTTRLSLSMAMLLKELVD